MLEFALLKPPQVLFEHDQQGEGAQWGGGVREIPPLIHLDSRCLLRGSKSLLLLFFGGIFLKRGMQQYWPCSCRNRNPLQSDQRWREEGEEREEGEKQIL